MSWAEAVYEGLKANEVKLICYLPDTPIGALIQLLERDPYFEVVSLAREEEGIGILAGGWMGGVRGALLMQNSGLGNSLNALGSLAIAQQIPFLMLMSARGDIGDFNPVQLPMGRLTQPVLDLLAIQHATLWREEEVRPMIARACKTAFNANLPIALLLPRELTGGKEG